WRQDPLHAHPKLVAVLPKREAGAVVGQDDMMKIGFDRLGRRELSHRAVIAAVPACELILVTGPAGLRSGIARWPTNSGQRRGEIELCSGSSLLRCGRS